MKKAGYCIRLSLQFGTMKKILKNLKILSPPSNKMAEEAQKLNLIIKLVEWGDYSAAVSLIQSSLIAHENSPILYFHLGECFTHLNRYTEAIDAYKTCLHLDPEDRLGVTIKLFLLNGIDLPETLPSEYVRCLFDQYSQGFDKNLEKLSYSAPEEAFQAVCDLTEKQFTKVLDIGCGTGLSSIPFRSRSQILEGVDVSSGMLDIAKSKHIFDQLHHRDISVFFKECRNIYDLILCMDVFIYLGKIDSVLNSIKSCLSHDGLFVFSVQRSTNQMISLGSDHRYAHSSDYVDKCAQEADFKIVMQREIMMRLEHGAPVKGIIYIIKKAQS